VSLQVTFQKPAQRPLLHNWLRAPARSNCENSPNGEIKARPGAFYDRSDGFPERKECDGCRISRYHKVKAVTAADGTSIANELR